MKKSTYDASSITVLTGLEAVRQKPAFYIGSEGTGENASVGFWTVAMAETVANALDECRSGYANHLVLEVQNKNHSYTIMDNGRGIPVEKHPKTGLSTLDSVFTLLHAGGKMNKDSTYKVSIGTFGIGAAVCCALSSSMKVWTFRHKKWYHQEYQNGGKPKYKNPITIKNPPMVAGLKPQKGTIVQVCPDMEFFDKTLKVDVEQVETFITNSLYFIKDVTVNMLLDGKKKTVKSQPPAKMIKEIAEIYECELLHEPLAYRDETLEVIFAWTTHEEPDIYSYVCGAETPEGGVHYNGFLKALEEAVLPYKGRNKFEMQDLIVGIIGVINVNITAPAFSNAIKTKLTTKGLDTEIHNKLLPHFKKWAKQNKELLQERCKLATEFATLRSQKKDERKLIADLSTKRGSLPLPPKLAQAPKCSPHARELFICLRGSTRILLVNGTSKPISKMVGKNYYIGYTFNQTTGMIEACRLKNIRKTGTNQTLMRVALDNNTHVDVTPEHKFLLRDGSYVKAKNLKIGTSLRRISFAKDRDYLTIYQPIDNYPMESVHRLVAKLNPNFDPTLDVHHKNEKKWDNRPSNLEQLSRSDHSKHHDVLPKYWSDGTNRILQSERVTRYFANPINRRKTAKATSKGMKNVDFTNINAALKANRAKYERTKARNKWRGTIMEAAKFSTAPALQKGYIWKKGSNLSLNFVANTYFAGDKNGLFKWLKAGNTKIPKKNPLIRRKQGSNKNELIQIAQKLIKSNIPLTTKVLYEQKLKMGLSADVGYAFQRYDNDLAKLEKEAKLYNHKVVSVNKLKIKDDVYCLTVEGTHNFAIENGIFVHNCEGDSAAGCYVGSTKIQLINGKTRTLTQMVKDAEKGIVHYGYAHDNTLGIRVVPLEAPRMTKMTKELIRITLDNGLSATCTPDHRWKLRDGSYSRADRLTVGESLMPHYERIPEKLRKINNHKITKITHITLKKAVPVYDLTVKKYHNFALACGVYVHNSAKQARNATNQEILPILGKISNACKTAVSKLVASDSVRNILMSIGYNPKAANPTENLRVGKILFLSDSDTDGTHINMLLIAMFQVLAPELFTQGKIYVVKGDLFLYRHSDGKKTYAANLEELKQKVGKSFKANNVGRIKGWGELNAKDMKPLAMDPNTRKIQQIHPMPENKLEEYNELMGENTNYRKKLLGLN